MQPFNQEEIYRYSRHFSVESVGITGQQKLKAAKILLVGAGGIGSPAGLYLAANGIGTIGIIDHDTIELSNLQRQVLYNTQDTGLGKSITAAKKLTAINPNITVKSYPFALSPDNANALFEDYDIIIDGTDNYATRYLVNDACRATQKCLISASIFQFTGQVACFLPDESPCYRCLYPAPPPPGLIPNCAQAGVLGVIPGILATLAVAQALKYILNLGETPIAQLTEFNALEMSIQNYEIAANPTCECCKKHKEFSMTTPSPTEENNITDITPKTLDELIKSKTQFTLIDVREDWEREISSIDNSIHIPLKEIPKADIPCTKDATIIIFCKLGGRSLKAAKILREKGYKNIGNLAGGIFAWIDDIQPNLMRY